MISQNRENPRIDPQNKWERLRYHKKLNKRKLIKETIMHQNTISNTVLTSQIVLAIKDFNHWLVKGKGVNSDHPYSVFVNFLKKRCNSSLSVSASRVINPSNIQVNYTDTHITDIILFDNNWPSWLTPHKSQIQTCAIEAIDQVNNNLIISDHHHSTITYIPLESAQDMIIDKINNFSFS